MKILVVDDNENAIYQLQVLLSGNGYEVETASNGADALEKARRGPPSLIVSDILMPVMDGFTLCKAWMRDDLLKRIPFIFYTATYTDEGDREFALSLGARRFILKPEEPDQFVRVIREVIAQVQEERPRAQPTPPPGYAREPGASGEETADHLRRYNAVLIRKLEDKLAQLEKVRQDLEQDIAERRRTEDELKRAHDRAAEALAFTQTLLNSLPTPVFVKDRAGHYLDCNRAYTEMFGLTADDIRGKTARDLWSADEAEAVCHQDEQLLRHNVCLTSESSVRDRSGKVRDVFLIGDVFRNAKGDVAGIIGTYVDLSERKRAEKQRMELEQRLRQAQKMEAIGQLAGGVAHDFNNILQAMQGYGQMLLEELDSRSEAFALAHEVYRGTERAAALTRQLLAFSRRQVLEAKDLDVNELIRDLLKMIRRLLGEHIELIFTPRRKGLIVHADPGQLDQVILNLCVNGRDAMPEGGKLVIETDAVDLDEPYCVANPWAKPGPYVLVMVSDTGHGMDETTRARIFDPFFTTKDVGKGTGLGLATVHGIVSQHGGMIHVYSEVSLGTTFRVYLPLVARSEDEEQEEQKEAVVGGHETILLAEDDPSVRRLTTTILEKAGYTVIQARDGEDAIQRIREQGSNIDLLLSDVVMPRGSGKNVLEFFRSQRPEGRVLFMSGYSTGVVEERYLESHKVAFIQKPFTSSALLRKIREQLD